MTARLLQIVITFLLLGFPMGVEGRTPRGVYATGAVRSVDHATQSVSFVRDDNAAPISFRWVKRTVFYLGAPDTSPSVLRPGMRLEISLHKPFFGSPFVTRLKLLHGS